MFILVAFAVVICFLALTLRRRATAQQTLTALNRFAKLSIEAATSKTTVADSANMLRFEELLSCHT